MAQIIMGAVIGIGTFIAGILLALFGAVAVKVGDRIMLTLAILALIGVASLYSDWLFLQLR